MNNNFIIDPNVNAFVKASGITGGTEFNAVNYLVIALKTAKLWDRINVLYPFVGGTANSHKYNLKDPRDLDAAFRITFSGSVTHDSNGVTFSLANGVGIMHFIPSTNLVQVNRECMGLYSRSSQAALNGIDMGCAVTITKRDEFIIRESGDTFYANINSTTAGSVNTTNTGGTGFFLASRVNSTDLRLFKNGSQVGTTQTSLNNGTRAAIKMYIGARNVLNAPQNFTGRNFALAIVGFSYTVAEVSTLNNIVQQYQTLLNRQV